MSRWLHLSLAFLIASLSHAGIVHASSMDTFEFEDSEQEAMFDRLSNEIRCLVCQNQSIADSNADLATDLRRELHTMVTDGKSEEEIVDFLVQRYGDYVLYRPPFKPTTWLLWFAPLLAFLLGLYVVRRTVAGKRSDDARTLSDVDQERLSQLRSRQNDTRNNNEGGDA